MAQVALYKNEADVDLNSETRFYAVNGVTLRLCRKRAGWSQVELARRAGYSERVIRKAEAGGDLKLETIQHIAEALSSEAIQVTTEELIQNTVSIAKAFVESYDQHGRDMLQHCQHHFDDGFEFEILADSDQLPFAGLWRGADGFQEFLNRFFSIFTRVHNSLTPNYMTGDGRVLARYDDLLFCDGHPLPPVWVNLHFHFLRGRILRIADEFDTLLAVQSLNEVRARKDPSLNKHA